MTEEWNFGDNFPSIEIDTDYWKTLKAEEKFKYIFRLIFQEKNLGNRMNMINYVMGTIATVGKTFVKNQEVRGYFDIIENSTKMIAVSAAIGNIFKAKQKYRNTKNNEMAKLMGFPNGNYIEEKRLEITQSMAETFIDISDFHREKYKLKVDNVQTDDDEKSSEPSSKNGSGEEYKSIIKNIKMTGEIEDIKFGLSMKTVDDIMDEEEDSTHTATCKLYYPVAGMKIHPEELKEKIQKIMYELYIDKVDTRSNYVKIHGTKLEICKRIHIRENIKNIDIPKITHAIGKTLEEKKRRGIVLVGEPGTGKTIALHKIINTFPDKLVFWVTSDSINSTSGIRNVFKIFKMFKNSIIVFDDLDAAPFVSKNETTNELLIQLDGTSKELTGFLIAAVNDPSKIHMTIINRPERFDDVFYVQLPRTNDEVLDIIFDKCNQHGYYNKKEFDEHFDAKGYIKFNRTNNDLSDICKQIIKAKFTQVQIAGLVSDCHTYSTDGNITVALLKDAVKTRLQSIEASNLVARKGRLKLDLENISDEAMAGLSRRSAI